MERSIDTTLYLKYKEFESQLILNDKYNSESNPVIHLIVENENNIYHSSWLSKEDIPMGGIYFEYINILTKFTKLRELRLIDLFIKDLPEDFDNLIELNTLELCFSRSADVEKNLRILKKLKSLKFLDLNGSRLSEKQRNYIRIELNKQGVNVNDIVMLKSNK
ncbi:hypothetical protein ACFQ3S_04970 [Mucilaginibacter terrae]|uniref:hypothetical protein n=1 Tax=Mucilaginibacter terrae TaxID=1955052 RepID=UPI003631E9EE